MVVTSYDSARDPMTTPRSLDDIAVTGPLGSLALSCVRPRSSMLAVRAVAWRNDLARLGIAVPLFLVHDLGVALTASREQFVVGARTDVGALLKRFRSSSFPAYRDLVAEITDSDVAERASMLQLNDDLVVALLARLLSGVVARMKAAPAYAFGLPLDASLFEGLDARLPELFAAAPRELEVEALERLEEARLQVLTVVDTLDVDTLQLFGLMGGDASRGAKSQVDLFNVLGDPEVNDVVDFSLEILPSILETKTPLASSRTASSGYAGLSRRGSVDSLVLTELAWDREELHRRLVDDELLYYSRETTPLEQRRLHVVLIDASASMRGARATFARGMALALAKKLSLGGEDVVFRFFDSRLSAPHACVGRKLPLAWVLSFKGERGRNPRRVFEDLADALRTVRTKDSRSIVIHLFTHAALYVPRELVADVAQLAQIAAVFTLPSGGTFDLDYTDLFAAHWVVDFETLADTSLRRVRARSILSEVDTDGATPVAHNRGARV